MLYFFLLLSCTKNYNPPDKSLSSSGYDNATTTTYLNAGSYTITPRTTTPDTMVANQTAAIQLAKKLDSVYSVIHTVKKMTYRQVSNLSNLVDPGDGGGTFSVTFYFDQLFPAPNYSVTIYFTIGGDGKVIDARVVTDTWGYGIFGNYNQTNGAANFSVSSNGTSITFNATGSQSTSIGFGNYSLNYGTDLYFYGWVQLDQNNNPVSGTARMGPKNQTP